MNNLEIIEILLNTDKKAHAVASEIGEALFSSEFNPQFHGQKLAREAVNGVADVEQAKKLAVKFKNEYNSSHELQPIFHKVNQLINNEWKTKLTLKTDAEGRIRFKGFCGTYSAQLKPTGGPAIGNRFTVEKQKGVNALVISTVL